MRFAIEHRFEVDLATFESHLNHPDLLARLRREVPGLADRALLDARAEGPIRTWRFRVRSNEDIPSPARKFLRPDLLSWVEESTYDDRTHAFRWRTVPDHFGEFVEASGTASLAPDGPSAVRRVIEGEVRVRVPLFAGTIESAIVLRLRRSYEAVARVERDFLRGIAAVPPVP